MQPRIIRLIVYLLVLALVVTTLASAMTMFF